MKNYRAPDTLVDFHTGAPPGEANCVVVRHTASDGSKGLHLRAIATMAPGTQLTITSDTGAKISILRPLY